MAGTFELDALTEQARNAGAKVLLVGDWAQLSPVAAGGAFHLLARQCSITSATVTSATNQHGTGKKRSPVHADRVQIFVRLGRGRALDAMQACV